MLCATTKKGFECSFMKKGGCIHAPANDCHEIVPQCEGCAHVFTLGAKKYCKAHTEPAAKWKFGPCNLGTHVVRKLGDVAKKVNPLKASKKAAAGK